MSSLSKKRTNKLTREKMSSALAVARGDQVPDLLIKNVTLLDLVSGKSSVTNIAIVDETIAGVGLEYTEGKRVYEAEGLTAVPGFIDSHLHIESSLMHPFEFQRVTLPKGTTSAICDPHEITNVLGSEGFEWFLRCSKMMEQNLFVQVSSCVPALPGFETVGGTFDLKEMTAYREHESVLGLAEMMNFPGVINGADFVLDKIEAFEGMNLDGHSPLLRGKGLNAYLVAGIENCHESVLLDEAKEKLEKGMQILLREGTVAKNLKNLSPIVNEFNSHKCSLCTDDRNPYEIAKEGHIDYLVRTLITELKFPLHLAYRLSSYSTAEQFGLKRLGLIAPGKRADILLLENPREVIIKDVLVGGKFVSEIDLLQKSKECFIQSVPPIHNSVKRDTISAKDFALALTSDNYQAIGIVEGEIITTKVKTSFDGTNFDQADILKIAVVERHGHNQIPSLGLVKGAGLKKGAIASSVAHDSHNIVVIGVDDESMALAVRELIQSGGGFIVVSEGRVDARLDLPIAGLMSILPAEQIADQIVALKKAYSALGGDLHEPFLQMAFLALPVIPSLKITDKGIMDVDQFRLVDLKGNLID